MFFQKSIILANTLPSKIIKSSWAKIITAFNKLSISIFSYHFEEEESQLDWAMAQMPFQNKFGTVVFNWNKRTVKVACVLINSPKLFIFKYCFCFLEKPKTKLSLFLVETIINLSFEKSRIASLH